MVEYTIQLTEAENKALAHVAKSPQEWIENAVKVRCINAIDEIVKSELERLFAANLPIPSSKDEIVLNADIKSAYEADLELQNKINQENL